MVRALSLVVFLTACGRIGFTAGGDGAPGAPDAPDLATGLRFAFHLDDTLADHDVVESAAGLDGYAVNLADVTTVPGKLGGAFHFDGIGYQSYVPFPSKGPSTCNNLPQLTGSLTVAAWARYDSLHDWNNYTLGDVMLMQGSSGGTGGAWGLGATNGCGTKTIGFEVAFNDAQRFVRCGATTIATGTWHFLTGVYDASARTVRVYLDGVDDTGPATNNSVSTIAAALAPGPMCPYIAASGNQSQLMIGSVDEVRIYDRALDAAEIAALFVASGG